MSKLYFLHQYYIMITSYALIGLSNRSWMKEIHPEQSIANYFLYAQNSYSMSVQTKTAMMSLNSILGPPVYVSLWLYFTHISI